MVDFIIKSVISMAVLLAAYHVFLEREKMHRFNRFFLLAALVFSLALPFVTIPVYVAAEPVAEQVTVPQAIELQSPQTVAVFTKEQPEPGTMPVAVWEPEINYWPYIVLGLYGMVTLALAVRFGINVSRFYRLKKKNTTTVYNGITLVLLENDILPHTFLGHIFISKNDYENRLIEPELFDHEMVHVKQRHTLDILFIETLKTIFWFNPVLYFYKKAIQLNHEFLADEKVVALANDVIHYQNLLLGKVSYGTTIQLASNLNFSITKKRLIMMTKTTNTTKGMLLKFAVLPVAAGLVYFLSTQTVIYAKETSKGVKTEPVVKNNALQDNVTQITAVVEDVLTPAATTEQVTKDTIGGDSRRDEYYKGVKIIIEDKLNGVFVTKPYEQLTAEQKRYYLQTPPKKRAVANSVNPADYDFTLKNESAIFYIDEKKVSREEFLKYKKEDFAYFASRTSGIGVKDGKMDMGTQQAFFFTPAFYKKHIRSIDDHYPGKTCKISINDKPIDTNLEDWKARNTSGKSDLEWDNERTAKEIAAETYPFVKNMKESSKDMSPEFPGGEQKFQEYLSKNLHLTDKYAEKQLMLYFVINTDGSISEGGTYDEVDDETKAEIKRVLESSPRWIPSQRNGKAQKVTTGVKFPKNN